MGPGMSVWEGGLGGEAEMLVWYLLGAVLRGVWVSPGALVQAGLWSTRGSPALLEVGCLK